MADQAKVTQTIAQVETLPAPKLKALQVVAQVETLPVPKLKALQVAAQVETLPTPRLKASQTIAQVEVILELGTGAGPTQEKLLHHGTWFDTTGKRRFWWAR